jgi:hypothetical protein
MKHGHLAPAKLPLTTYLSGPTVGGSWGPGETAPRSVNLEFFNRVCPEKERLIVNGTEERIRMGINEETTTDLIMGRWAERLKGIEERCVQINGWCVPLVQRKTLSRFLYSE